MKTIRSEARRKGLRMAAHVAALSGVLAAAAAASQAAEAKTPGAQGSASVAGDGANDGAERLADLVRVNASGGCGCAPCWGPPAPPAMRIDLMDAFADVAEEVEA